MKKLIFMFLVIILLFSLELCSYTVKPRMTKTVVPQYSGLTGRRYYFPTNEDREQDTLIINVNNPYSGYLNYGITDDSAQEINRRKRVELLERSSVKPKGIPQQGEIVGLPEDYKAQLNVQQ